jgi:hypothetical protein
MKLKILASLDTLSLLPSPRSILPIFLKTALASLVKLLYETEVKKPVLLVRLS